MDLSTCAQEPIRIPGSIQPHGFLLVLEEKSFRVLQASTNLSQWLSFDVLGKPLEDLFGSECAAMVRSAIGPAALESSPLYLRTLTIATPGGPRSFHAIAHRSQGALILELEFARTEQAVQFSDLYSLVRTFMAELQTANDIGMLSFLAAREVRRISGFDRVLIYQFDSNWNGHVVAEDRHESLPSYLDLWFPASDIPPQARELYRLNRLRLIADVHYQPVAIAPPLHPESNEPLDLSFSTLRSVSPIHIEYLKNMGVGASMSISILRGGELWGLIACHHRTPRSMPFEVRTACDFLGQALSLQLAAAEQTAEYEGRLRLKVIESQLLTYMAQEEHFVDGLTKHPDDLLRLAGAHGAAVLFDDNCALVGKTPSEEAVRNIADWLADNNHNEVFHSETFPHLVPDAEAYQAGATGVLAISISKLYRSYVIWFRKEVIQTVTWSGDPAKPVEAGADGSMKIHPRKSFEAWQQIVRGRSFPWQRSELETAANLRISILEIVLRRAEEVAHLSNELKRSNKELEAFSYSISHDLRAPFRHIVGYSSLLRERVAGSEDPEAVRYIDTIIESANSAGSLVDNLLHFAQIGRSALQLEPIDQSSLIAEVQNEIERELPTGREITWRVNDLPKVRGDRVLLRVVWQNLLSNAAKYTRDQTHPVVEIGSQELPKEFIFFVRDNGVGFDSRYSHKLFGVFQRLHKMEDFEGNGIGLANVRRIVSRHGGRTWAEGILGQGATFYFSLPAQ